MKKGKLAVLEKSTSCNGLLSNTTQLPGILLTLLLALGLKHFFSQAGAEELFWMLRPVAATVSLFSGMDFIPDARFGFISLDHSIIIAPACSGINFMIAALLCIAFSSLITLRPGNSSLATAFISLLLAWLLTIVINSIRILLAMALYDADIYWGWFTGERLHRLMGVMIYLPALIACHYGVILYFSQERTVLRGRVLLLPLGCYLGIVVALPLLKNPGAAISPLFQEHLLSVFLGCGLVLLPLFLLHLRRSP